MTNSQETLMQKWAVKTVSDPTVGNLQTPVNSGWFTKMVINNLPVYREGLSPNFRGLETGAIFGYLLFGPFSMTGPLRNTDFALTAGLLGGVGAIQILTALFILYNAAGKAPNVQPPDATVAILLLIYLLEQDGMILQMVFGWEVQEVLFLLGC